MSKEDSRQQILKKWIDLINPHEDGTQAIYAAMAEFANEQAIAFAKYILLMDIEYDFGEEMWWNNKNTNWLTEEQLYELFLQSKKQ